MEFVSYESPVSFKESKKRDHAVRSHVTRRQHRLKREAMQKALDDKQPWTDPWLSIWDSTADADESPSSSSSSSQPPNSLHWRMKRPARKNAMDLMPPRLPPQVPYELMYPCESAFNTLETYIHTTMVPTHVAAFGIDQSEALVSSNWFSSSSRTEPALRTSALLTAAPNFQQYSPELVLHLKTQTITQLVKALSCEERRQDPALVLAVECLMFYEFLYGDKTAAQTVHRPAMRKLIKSHGGRDGLAIPISWRKVSIMADLLMEMQMGAEGETSFLEDERHEDARILESQWTESLRLYLPDSGEQRYGPHAMSSTEPQQPLSRT